MGLRVRATMSFLVVTLAVTGCVGSHNNLPGCGGPYRPSPPPCDPHMAPRK